MADDMRQTSQTGEGLPDPNVEQNAEAAPNV